MKHCWFSTLALIAVSLFSSIALHAQQPKFYSNAKPMTFGYNLKTYYDVQKINLTRVAEATPEDMFFALPPGCTPQRCRGEQSSIGAEIAHAADAQYRMCKLMATGMEPPPSTLPGTVVRKSGMPTKAAMLDALKESFDVCDPLIDNFKDDADAVAMVDSQHALQPFGTTIFNTVTHDREVYGRIKSYMAAEGIKQPPEQDAKDPANPNDMYYCGGTESKTNDNCK